MPKKRSCHFEDRNFKYVEDYQKKVGYKHFNTALNVIIKHHRKIQEWRVNIINKTLKDIHYFGLTKEELFKE